MQDYTQIFNQYITKDNKKFLMLNRKIEFPSDQELYIYKKITIADNIPWTNLSYTLYGSIDYWWVLCRLNPDYIFYAPADSEILIIKKEHLFEILNTLNSL